MITLDKIEAIVRQQIFNNKWMIILLPLVCFCCSYFLTLQHPHYAIFSQIALVLTNIPIIGVLYNAMRWKGIALYIVLGIYAWCFESASILSGFPYGNFAYTEALGHKILGLAAWTTPLGWLPLFFGALYATERLIKKHKKIWFLLILVGIDFVLDPAAVGLGFWGWVSPGVYYGVPFINFVGWLISGIIAYYIYTTLFKEEKKCIGRSSFILFIPYLLSIGMWTGVNIWLGHMIPALLGVGGWLAVYYFRDKLS